MSGQDKKPAARSHAPLIAAARAQQAQTSTASAQQPPAPSNGTRSSASGIPPLVRTATGGSHASSAGPSRLGTPVDPSAPVQKMKFRPKIPPRPSVKKESDVKPDIAASSSAPSRGGSRGRGRGIGRGGARQQRPPQETTGSLITGVFGAGKPIAGNSSRRSVFTPASSMSHEVYSEPEEDDSSSPGVRSSIRKIDIDAVPGTHESAPTSLIRDRKLHGSDKLNSKTEKGKEKTKPSSEPKRVQRPEEHVMDVDSSDTMRVKDEPVSPVKKTAPQLPPLHAREDDTMMSDDESQDRDVRGRRLRRSTVTGDIEGDDVNEAQAVDLSESDEEEDEPDMEGDFVVAPGQDNPEDRLFVFQMPPKMPRFLPTGPIDVTANDDTKEGVKDVKPSIQALKSKKKAQPPPDGRIGTLVVMKSGKVKLVLGKDIVMNVIPGANDHFLSHLVHVDKPHKSATVLGEVFRQYHLEPDVDGLLHQLQVHDGETPGDKAAELQKLKAAVKLEKGLVKMEDEL